MCRSRRCGSRPPRAGADDADGVSLDERQFRLLPDLAVDPQDRRGRALHRRLGRLNARRLAGRRGCARRLGEHQVRVQPEPSTRHRARRRLQNAAPRHSHVPDQPSPPMRGRWKTTSSTHCFERRDPFKQSTRRASAPRSVAQPVQHPVPGEPRHHALRHPPFVRPHARSARRQHRGSPGFGGRSCLAARPSGDGPGVRMTRNGACQPRFPRSA